MSGERTYWPEFLVDEIMPDGHDSPNDWIGNPPNIDADGCLIVGTDHLTRSVAVGDVLNFCWCEPRGMLVPVTFFADGSYEVTGGEPDDYMTCWAPADIDSISNTLKDLAEYIVDVEDLQLGDDVEHPVTFSKWSVDAEPWQLIRTGEGLSFTPLAMTSAIQ